MIYHGKPVTVELQDGLWSWRLFPYSHVSILSCVYLSDMYKYGRRLFLTITAQWAQSWGYLTTAYDLASMPRLYLYIGTAKS